MPSRQRGGTSGTSPRADRASQFVPFAALRGYYDLVRRQERTTEPRHELDDDEAAELSRTFAHVRRRTLVAITHYEGGAYVTTRGMVSDIDEAARTITVVRTRISLDDIIDIEEC